MIGKICSLLPEYLTFSILSLSSEMQDKICEIRLRRNGPISVSTYEKNLFLDKKRGVTSDISSALVCTAQDMDFVINRLSEGSFYRHMPTINSGYIVTPSGIRAGVCGECIYDGEKISSLGAIGSVNLRISRDIDSSGDVISRYLIKNPSSSVLLYSPPGYGKTTAVRSVAKAVGTGKFGYAKRVAVIDERGEILPGGSEGLIDRFCGYRKSDGIEIATRLFSPELIICDEIGKEDDTEALLCVQNSGVPLLATSHGDNIMSVKKRPNIKRLIDNGVFDAFALIEKSGDGKSRIVFQEDCE